MNKFKLIAAACALVYLLLYLFLPFMSVALTSFGFSGSDAMSLSAWCYIPLVCGIAMVICSIFLPGKISAIIAAVGAFMPLLVFFIVRGELTGDVSALIGIDRIPGLSAVLGRVSAVFKLGIGGVLSMISGVGCAVLCFLSDSLQKPAARTAGLGVDEDSDW